jgi:streptomycin 3"-adenylyltransferase
MQYGWRDCPGKIREQVERFTRLLSALLGSELVGVYLHGSLVFGSFNPERSDVDQLVVVARPLSRETRREIARRLLQSSQQPCPFEITFVQEAALHSGEYPIAFEFHYSELWREWTQQHRENEEWQWGIDREQRDPDLTGQVAITQRHGIVLLGEPVKRILPELPEEQITACFLQDCADALADIVGNPLYGILNPCRTLYFLETGHFCSKDEAGDRARDWLPVTEQGVVQQALGIYRGDLPEIAFDRAALQRFAEQIQTRIREHPSQSAPGRFP